MLPSENVQMQMEKQIGDMFDTANMRLIQCVIITRNQHPGAQMISQCVEFLNSKFYINC